PAWDPASASGSSAWPALSPWAVALNDRAEGYRYPPRVWFEINQSRLGEYRLAADFLNMSSVDVCCLQHEYGLFGGRQGQYILELVRRLRVPVVTTLHTILKDPDPDQRQVIEQLNECSDRLVVMAEQASTFLTEIYKVPREKIVMIPHGIPDVPFVDPNFYKDQFGVEGRKVILTFGLLSPNKGIEHMIDALPRIVAKHPDAVYIVLGATHPGVMAQSGEDYRLSLKRRANELGVQEHVEFVNKFVETEELIEFLGAADVYVTPYLNEAQITSGTLAYALGTGKAAVSTPYWYAREMLDGCRGVLVPFRDPQALADAVIDLFDRETERHAMRKRAYQFTRRMRWHEVAAQYLDLFAAVREERNRRPRPAPSSRALRNTSSELPQIKLDHLMVLTDDVGVLHRARSTVPDRASGYSTDNNALALIAALLAQDHLDYAAGANLDAMVCRYLSFLHHAFDESTGRFRHMLGYDRRWRRKLHSEDAHGRAVWALGEAVARCQLRGHMTLATSLFQRALPACEQFRHPHAVAYALVGIHAYLRRFSGDSHARRVRERMANHLLDQFHQNAGEDWPWPVSKVSYAAARLPQALLLSGRWTFRDDMIQMALRCLEWLHKIQTGPQGQFAPVGSDGWLLRGGNKARFNQHPISTYAALDAYLEAFRVTSDRKWLDRAYRCFNWFLGDNDLYLPLYDHTTGGCHDALEPHGVNENQSAEATLSWLLSLMSLYEHAFDSGAAQSRQPAEPSDQPRPVHPSAQAAGDGPRVEVGSS
ncbi:MAG TPA: glycosyltransferase family 4 protein, partial [Phycisphaeraceae bacterium]